MPESVRHSDAQKRFLAMLTDPSKGKRRMSMEEAIKKANKKFPKEKIGSVSAGYSMVYMYRKNNGGKKTSGNDQWEEMLEAGAALRKTKKWTYAKITEELEKKYNSKEVPQPTTLSAFCRRKGIENGVPSNGTSDKPLMIVGNTKLFRSPRKGRILVEMPKDQAIQFAMKEANLET
jgi:hypothetical protein